MAVETMTSPTHPLTLCTPDLGYVRIPVLDAPENPADIVTPTGPTYQDVAELEARGWSVLREEDLDDEIRVWMFLTDPS